MKINMNPDLAAYKAELLKKVDSEAEEFRYQFITPGSGQAMAYQEKEWEAKEYQANSTVGPHLDEEAKARGVTVADVAQLVLDTAASWRGMSAKIEGMRMGAKLGVENATTVAEARTAGSPDWDSLLVP